MDRLFIISLLLLTIILITNPSTTHAHRLVIEPLEPGEIRVVYDDSRFSTRTTVTVYDVNGIVLQTGGLDDQGYFHYDENHAHFFVADDRISHRTEWTAGEEVVLSRILIAGL